MELCLKWNQLTVPQPRSQRITKTRIPLVSVASHAPLGRRIKISVGQAKCCTSGIESTSEAALPNQIIEGGLDALKIAPSSDELKVGSGSGPPAADNVDGLYKFGVERRRASSSRDPVEDGRVVKQPFIGATVEDEPSKNIWQQIKDILLFAGPALGIWWSPPIISLIDTAVVGNTSSLQLAALGPGTILCDQLSYVFTFLSIATSNLIATSLANKVVTSQPIAEMARTAFLTPLYTWPFKISFSFLNFLFSYLL